MPQHLFMSLVAAMPAARIGYATFVQHLPLSDAPAAHDRRLRGAGALAVAVARVGARRPIAPSATTSPCTCAARRCRTRRSGAARRAHAPAHDAAPGALRGHPARARRAGRLRRTVAADRRAASERLAAHKPDASTPRPIRLGMRSCLPPRRAHRSAAPARRRRVTMAVAAGGGGGGAPSGMCAMPISAADVSTPTTVVGIGTPRRAPQPRSSPPSPTPASSRSTAAARRPSRSRSSSRSRPTKDTIIDGGGTGHARRRRRRRASSTTRAPTIAPRTRR